MAHVQSKPVASSSKSKSKGKAAANTSPKKTKSRTAAAEATAAVVAAEEPTLAAQKRGRKRGARGYSLEMGKGKAPVVIDEDNSSEPEIIEDTEPTASKKRKADDEPSVVLIAYHYLEDSDTAARRQDTATQLVGQLVNNMDPEQMEKLAATCQESTMATALLLGKDTQIAELQRDISNIRERHDREIRDIRDRHDRKVHQERELHIQAEHKLAQLQSVLTMMNMLGLTSGPGVGGVITAALGGAGVLGGDVVPSAPGASMVNPPLLSVNPQPTVANHSVVAVVPLILTNSHSDGAYTLAGSSSGLVQDPTPAGSAETAGLATNT
ncbi:hypothetical protein FRC09_004976 [Ceratobasidium sp. 395]|nr:hypothetical protein FRC09_004976 [Ceratobasidium sp. 395]